ncbi:MAG: hypothetical protein ACOY71_04185 [Gemmatimonadota bacterium]
MNGQDEWGPVPPELEGLDRELGAARFGPRASLGPEVIGRVRRGEHLKGDAVFRRHRPALRALVAGAGLAAAAVLAAVVVVVRQGAVTRVDRCCADYDGGGVADDGIVVIADRREHVRRVALYEDVDGSRGYTRGDVLRFERGPTLMLHDQSAEGLVTTRHCCLDYDGGGPDDDGVIVMGVPPDRIVMIALYEQRRPRAADGYRLR